MELRRDLLDEGVVRKAKCKEIVLRMGLLSGKGLRVEEKPRVKLRGVLAIVPSLRQLLLRPLELCP